MKMKAPFSEKDAFIEEALPLVHYVAKRFYTKAKALHVGYDDLYSTGCVGLVKAYNGFDSSKGFQFSTYAEPTISGEIQGYLLSNYPLKIPRAVKELAKKISWHKFERKPAAVLANYFDCSVQMAERALASLKIRVSSIDCSIPGEEDSRTIQDLIPHHEDFTVYILNDFLRLLTEKERDLVQSRMAGFSQREIGQFSGVSQISVSKWLRKIEEKTSEYFEVV